MHYFVGPITRLLGRLILPDHQPRWCPITSINPAQGSALSMAISCERPWIALPLALWPKPHGGPNLLTSLHHNPCRPYRSRLPNLQNGKGEKLSP